MTTGNEATNVRRGAFAYCRYWLPILILIFVGFHSNVSRQLIVLLAQAVKDAYGLSDTQLGGIVSVGGIAVACLGPFLGQITDVFDRHKLLAVNIVIWSLATAGYGLAGSYAGMMLSFVMMCAAAAFIGPISGSLIADRYRGLDRVTANLSVFAAGTMTAGGATLIAGMLLAWASGYGPPSHSGNYWQLALAVLALAGLPLAAASWALGDDPRPPRSGLAGDARLLLDYWSAHWKAFLPFCLAQGSFSIGAMAVMGWIPIYIVRHFGIAPADLGTKMGMVVLFADVFGVVFGLMLIKSLYRRFGPIALRLIFQGSLVPIAALVLALPFARDTWDVLLLLGLMNVLATFGSASCNNMLQEITPPAGRGKIFGIFVFIGALMSLPGPVLVGVLSDYFQATPDGLLWSIMIVALCGLTLSFVLYGSTNGSYLKAATAIREQESGSCALAPLSQG